MASSRLFFYQVLINASFSLLPTLTTCISLGSQLPDIRMLRSCNIHSIYQFGDSLSDTGNRKLEDPFYLCNQLPYGESLFQDPTGRCSDGLLMIDYIASAAGIPFLNPYLKSSANFIHGVNFAVGSSTALSANILAKENITLSESISSLGVQLQWMSTYFASECNKDMDCSSGSLRNALFMVGETGGNDYNFALLQGKTIEEAQNMVPEVVEVIKDAVRTVIGFGAAQVIVPGDFPIGCLPGFLTIFESDNTSTYDENQCLKELNDFAAFHNKNLQQAIIALQEENPATTIVYADYYNAFKWLLHNAPHLGIDAASILKSCCGRGGSYSYSATEPCGSLNVPVCSNPEKYISWDGLHMTQKAYSIIAQWLVADIIPKLNCNNHCSPGCMKNALVIVGEIGGNDYIFGFLQGKAIEEARIMVPGVVEIITYAIRRVIAFGAAHIIVPGNFPIGCFPAMLMLFISNKIYPMTKINVKKSSMRLQHLTTSTYSKQLIHYKKKIPPSELRMQITTMPSNGFCIMLGI